MCLNNTLCWDCKNLKCSWMKKGKPVDGWEAEARENGAYKVIKCPEHIAPIVFIGGAEHKKLRKVLDKINDGKITTQEYNHLMRMAKAIVKRLEGENE